MIRLPVHATRLHAVAMAAMLAALSSTPARAVDVSVYALAATGTYQLDADAFVNVSPVALPGSVDVLAFPYGSGGSNAGLHSYGDTSGNFGSRSSGGGLYDVTGGFSIGLHIANNGSTAQRVNFGFHITPGYIQNGLIGFGAGQYVESGISFNIQTNTGSGMGSIWSTSGALRSNSGGTTFTELESDASISLFSGSGPSRMVDGKSYTLDLGVLNAGQSMDLLYDIRSFARGNALNGVPTFVPDQIIDVPGQWVDYCSGGYGDGYGPSVCVPQYIEPYQQVIKGYTTFEGQMGSSQASSGDPFQIDSYDGHAYQAYDRAVLPPGLEVGVGVVPEPATYGLLAMGLLAVGSVVRRRRAS